MTSSLSSTEWKAYLTEHPEAHLLQTTQWGELKSTYGWDVEYIRVSGCGAQVLFRRFPLGITLAYIPKGPVGEWLPTLLPQLDALCIQRRAFVLKIEPDADWDPKLAERMRVHGFTNSHHYIQPHRTLIVNLQGDEDQILGRMNQKTRYNIRLASRKGVTVRPWDDLEGFGHMMQETAARDQFGAHIPIYYQHAYNLFHPGGACEIFVAEYEGTPLAALMVFARGYRAWYFYGASTTQHRNLMPNYLLQWEAMRWAREKGCLTYDLWGIPDYDLDDLEDQFKHRSDGLWGVYRFKRGFGGELVRSSGAWDLPLRSVPYGLYRLYTRLTSRQ